MDANDTATKRPTKTKRIKKAIHLYTSMKQTVLKCMQKNQINGTLRKATTECPGIHLLNAHFIEIIGLCDLGSLRL